MPDIERRSAACEANAFPAILSLQSPLTHLKLDLFSSSELENLRVRWGNIQRGESHEGLRWGHEEVKE